MLQYGNVLVTKRTFNTAERKELAKSGAAMPDGSYPITNGADLDHAVSLVGMGNAPESSIKAHIKTRAKELGLESKLPDSWGVKKVEVVGNRSDSLVSRSDLVRKQELVKKNWDEWNSAHQAEKAHTVEQHQNAADYHSNKAAEATNKVEKAAHMEASLSHKLAATASSGPEKDQASQEARENSYKANNTSRKSELVKKGPFALDSLQSDPATTDTMEEDYTVDTLKVPKPYLDVMQTYPRDRLKSPAKFGIPQGNQMNAANITKALTNTNP